MTGPTKSVRESAFRMSQLMRPHHGNFVGNVHGGTILAMMDEVAYTCASKYAETYCVTAAIDMVEFMEPVRVGDVVTLHASVNRVGRSSMDIGIRVVAENPQEPNSARRTNRCFITMVALDAKGRPKEVPRLRLETDEDRRWECEAELRRQLRRRYRRDLEAGVCAMAAGNDTAVNSER